MRVMHLIDSLKVGGAERMLVEIANATVRKNYQVSVCITRQTGSLSNLLDSHIKIYELNRRRKFDIHGLLSFTKVIEKEHPDILHVHGRTTYSFVLLCCLIFNRRIPIILHDHYGSIHVNKKIPIWFRYYGNKRVSFYLAVCKELRDWALEAKIPSNRVRIINNALQLDAYMGRKVNPFPKGEIIGIYVAGIRYEKGFHILIEALSRLQKSARIKIMVVGGIRDQAYYDKCIESARKLGVFDQLVIVGERTDVPHLLLEADFAIIPSMWESGPLVLIEYIASGLPVIYTTIGNIAERVFELQVPGAMSPGSVDDLVRELEKLQNSSVQERNERSAISRQLALEMFNIDIKIDEFISIYEDVLSVQK